MCPLAQAHMCACVRGPRWPAWGKVACDLAALERGCSSLLARAAIANVYTSGVSRPVPAYTMAIAACAKRHRCRPLRADVRACAALPLNDARPGLCRKGVRVPAAQGDLRSELRAGDARHALLHRLPEAHRPALRGRRRRVDRPGEGRGPARLRWPGHADRA